MNIKTNSAGENEGLHNINPQFIDSVRSAEESNGKFFTVNFGSNQIKIYFEKDACNWVWNYKYRFQQDTVNLGSQLGTKLEKNKLGLINYFYIFIIQDISNLNNHISPSVNSILDIGAGIGLFDLFLNQILPNKKSFDLIEVEKLDEIEHVRNNPDITKNLSNDIKIKPVATLKKFMIVNNAININIISYKKIDNHAHKKYDLILSFRSWGFLYDLKIYEKFVRNTLNPDGIVITDLSIYDNLDSIKKFSALFHDVTLINETPNNKRFIGKNLK